MKKLVSVILVIVMGFSLSSCLKVHVVLPERNFGVVYNPVDATEAPVQNTAPTEAVTAPPVVATTAAPATAAPVEITTVAPVEVTTAAPVEITTVAPVEPTTAAPSSGAPLEMSKEELLGWFNHSLNSVKENKPGFERAKQTTVADIVLSNQLANTLVGFVKGMLLSEEVETATAAKGQSCSDLMSPDGQNFVSQLSMADIKDIAVAAEGTGYAVTVTLPDAENPTKEEGAYSKIFNFITVDDVVNTYAPKVGATVARENIKVTYSGCTAKAVISADGKVEAYHTYVTCVVELKDATVKKGVTINTDVEFTLVSTVDYTNFVY